MSTEQDEVLRSRILHACDVGKRAFRAARVWTLGAEGKLGQLAGRMVDGGVAFVAPTEEAAVELSGAWRTASASSRPRCGGGSASSAAAAMTAAPTPPPAPPAPQRAASERHSIEYEGVRLTTDTDYNRAFTAVNTANRKASRAAAAAALPANAERQAQLLADATRFRQRAATLTQARAQWRAANPDAVTLRHGRLVREARRRAARIAADTAWLAQSVATAGEIFQ